MAIITLRKNSFRSTRERFYSFDLFAPFVLNRLQYILKSTYERPLPTLPLAPNTLDSGRKRELYVRTLYYCVEFFRSCDFISLFYGPTHTAVKISFEERRIWEGWNPLRIQKELNRVFFQRTSALFVRSGWDHWVLKYWLKARQSPNQKLSLLIRRTTGLFSYAFSRIFQREYYDFDWKDLPGQY